MVKKTAAQFLARSLDASGLLGALERLDSGNRLRVLVYHRVDEPASEPDLDPGLISATPDEFREQMQMVVQHFNPVSLATVLAAQHGEGTLPPSAVLITFDDGYIDFAKHAWPVMRDLGVPVVLFVSTAFPGQVNGAGFWWDRLYAGLRRSEGRRVVLPDLGLFDLGEPNGVRVALKACKRHVKSLHHGDAMNWVAAALRELDDIPSVHRVLDWGSLSELARQGVDVCAHGHEHALCTRLNADELREDLGTCQGILRHKIGSGSCASVIAWPANAFNSQVGDIALDLGFELAFGGVRGVAQLPVREVMNVMRIPVLRYGSALFRAQMRPGIASLGRYVVDGPRRAVAN
jgi:peptidoglycan/xylan/chitin deacetylase (PgdA/CDA1 family)